MLPRDPDFAAGQWWGGWGGLHRAATRGEGIRAALAAVRSGGKAENVSGSRESLGAAGPERVSVERA